MEWGKYCVPYMHQLRGKYSSTYPHVHRNTHVRDSTTATITITKNAEALSKENIKIADRHIKLFIVTYPEM